MFTSGEGSLLKEVYQFFEIAPASFWEGIARIGGVLEMVANVTIWGHCLISQ